MELSREQKSQMAKVATGFKTKSDRIRALDRAGFKRADISRFLDIRYQHVRNVLIQSHVRNESQTGEQESAPRQEWAQVAADGRVVIPISFRKALGIEQGGDVLMMIENEELRLMSRAQAIRHA